MIYNDNSILINLLPAEINQVLTKSTLMDYSQSICNRLIADFLATNYSLGRITLRRW